MLDKAHFHHIGILTRDLAESTRLYVSLFNYTEAAPVVRMEDMGIEASHLEAVQKPRVELIHPLDPASTLGRLAGAGTTGYHLAWSVPDLPAASRVLIEDSFHALPAFRSSLWNNAACRFFVGPGGELVELIELSNQ